MTARRHGLSDKEIELVQLLVADCKSTGDIQQKLKRLFAGTIKQEQDSHYMKNIEPVDWETLDKETAPIFENLFVVYTMGRLMKTVT